MNDDFERLMTEATRLVQSGSLTEATAAIQRALGGAPAAARAPMPRDDAEIIDVEVRVIGEPVADPRAPRRANGESFTSGHFKNECGGRDYKLFTPAREDDRLLPLVVMLHGCTQDPDDFARGTRMNALARERGFLVLYPSQSQRANAQRCWSWFKHNHQARGKGEPAILAGIVREVVEAHGVDAARVYVAGLSAGGAMAAILGDAYPDLFAAVGVHSGLPTGSARDVQSAFAAMSGGAPSAPRPPRTSATPPTIVFHGDADKTVNVVNGERILASAGLAAQGDASRGSSAMGVPYSRRVHVDGRGAERGEQWTIHGAGHAWAGGDLAGSYTDPRGPDASAEMLRFFLQHPKA
ncbi:alpha/beta hydrolase family esterase [Scleromatobacter humisilvae]|uniref:PHB depolymerase family esterase n=1 Tax=Scleromatobacter humisilvae TaxID=2897159 RepID=A0A9X2C0E0_9BURK|nr:PHB depolymerase family esterase [Scleromatobacter humisilvae]MCK9686326.1 PHB depolymerase family esterase [Scleromatobacter humisilvae]